MKRTVFALAMCQAIMMTCMSLIGTIAALVGLSMAENKALATLPHGSQFLGMMLVTLPASLLMGKIGRRAGFYVGVGLGMVGAIGAIYAIQASWFAAFCCASFLIGASSAFGQYFRFAAADVATEAYRSRAISLVLSGGVVAAFSGPNLAGLTINLLPGGTFAGGYGAVAALYCLMALVLGLVRVPKPVDPAGRGLNARPLTTIARQPMYITAVACALLAYSSMTMIMTSTPIAMSTRALPFPDTVSVIQWHVLGMFAPAFVTGHLIRWFGLLKVMLVGALLTVSCAIASIVGESTTHFLVALFALGVGWNFLFTGATTLLTATYNEAEKAKAQGLNDLLLFSGVAGASLFSGVAHHHLGWINLNLVLLPMAGGVILLLAWIGWYRRRTATA